MLSSGEIGSEGFILGEGRSFAFSWQRGECRESFLGSPVPFLRPSRGGCVAGRGVRGASRGAEAAPECRSDPGAGECLSPLPPGMIFCRGATCWPPELAGKRDPLQQGGVPRRLQLCSNKNAAGASCPRVPQPHPLGTSGDPSPVGWSWGCERRGPVPETPFSMRGASVGAGRAGRCCVGMCQAAATTLQAPGRCAVNSWRRDEDEQGTEPFAQRPLKRCFPSFFLQLLRACARSIAAPRARPAPCAGHLRSQPSSV